MEAIMNTKFKLFKNQKGMTLIELLAVIVILGVIAAIAVPAIGSTVTNSKEKADAQTVLLIYAAAERYANDNNPTGSAAVGSVPLTAGTVTVATLAGGYLQSAPLRASGTTAGAAYISCTVTYSAGAGWVASGIS
jgi:type IV pilus assembly protein PilA